MMTGLLGGVVGMAASIPEKLGQEAQQFAQQATQAVSGLASGLGGKDKLDDDPHPSELADRSAAGVVVTPVVAAPRRRPRTAAPLTQACRLGDGVCRTRSTTTGWPEWNRTERTDCCGCWRGRRTDVHAPNGRHGRRRGWGSDPRGQRARQNNRTTDTA